MAVDEFCGGSLPDRVRGGGMQRAGEYRFVRVTPVLIMTRTRTCVIRVLALPHRAGHPDNAVVCGSRLPSETRGHVRSPPIALPHRASRTVTGKRQRNEPKSFRTSDTRVIISAYRIENISDDYPCI